LIPVVVGRQARIFDGDGVQLASDHRPVFVDVSLRDKKAAGQMARRVESEWVGLFSDR
jgi:hypothetical protein